MAIKEETHTVHAAYDGMEIVRYNRAGKWYLEPTNKNLKRQHVTIKQAADQAIWARRNLGSAQVFLGKPGGMRFDKLVREGGW